MSFSAINVTWTQMSKMWLKLIHIFIQRKKKQRTTRCQYKHSIRPLYIHPSYWICVWWCLPLLLMYSWLVSTDDDAHNYLMLHYDTHKMLMTHDTLCVLWVYDFHGNVIWQIFLLFLDHVSQSLLVSYGLHWNVKSYLNLLKSPKLQLRRETLDILFMIVEGRFLPNLSELLLLNISFLVHKLFSGRKPLIKVVRFPMNIVFLLWIKVYAGLQNHNVVITILPWACPKTREWCSVWSPNLFEAVFHFKIRCFYSLHFQSSLV